MDRRVRARERERDREEEECGQLADRLMVRIEKPFMRFSIDVQNKHAHTMCTTSTWCMRLFGSDSLTCIY